MRICALILSLTLSGCAGFGDAGTCLLASQKPMIASELFFGRDVAGRAPVSDVEWHDFESRVIAANFPDGFTVMRGHGMWRNPATHASEQEDSIIVSVVTPDSADLASRLNAVRTAYKNRFHQMSVGLVTRKVCAEF